jgi:hypothetical protein
MCYQRKRVAGNNNDEKLLLFHSLTLEKPFYSLYDPARSFTYYKIVENHANHQHIAVERARASV